MCENKVERKKIAQSKAAEWGKLTLREKWVPVAGHQGGLVGGGGRSQKCQIEGIVSPTKGAAGLKASKWEALGSLGSQPLLPQKSKEEGSQISPVSRYTHPPFTTRIYGFNQLWIQSSSWAQPYQQHSTGTTLRQLVSSFPGHRGETCNFPPRGKCSGRPGCSVLPQVPPSPTLTGSSSNWPLRRASHPFGSAWLPDTYHRAQPVWDLAHGGSSSASLRSASPTLTTDVCSS